MYIVCETLESAALAAAVANASEADRTTVAAAHRRLERAALEDDRHSYHRQSRHFHIGMARPSGMLRLVHMLESAWNVTEPVQLMVHVEPAERAALHTDHGRMLEAFLDRDVDALLATTREHHKRLNTVVAALPPDTGLVSQG
jgi:DNA-binding GntR family transcriptional regulator